MKFPLKRHYKGGEDMEDNTGNNDLQFTPKRMIVALLYPKKKHHQHMDQKTINHLHNIEQRIGIVDMIHSWEHDLLSVDYRYSLFWNPTCEGYAHVGREGSKWIVQVFLLTKGEQHDVIRYVFSKLPNAEDILVANTLNQIYAFYRSLTDVVGEITCYKCERRFHWIDQAGTLEYKWISLQENYCGCEE